MQRRIFAQNAATGTILQTNGQRITALTTDQHRALARERVAARSSTPVTVQSGTTSSTTEPKNVMPLSVSNILNAAGSAVQSLFGGSGTATSPTVTSTLGTVGSVVTSVLGGTMPGAMVPVAAATVLPGRANSGVSEFLLERPAGSSSGSAGGSALARLGFPPGWTRKKVKALVRYVGPGQASAIIGAPLESVAIVAVSGGRRSRGISARDLRVTKRVTRRVLGIARDLQALRPSAPRRSSSRTVVRCN